jgi:hypothetical protein
MNRIYSLAVSTALIVWALPMAQARSKPKDASISVQAMGIFEQIEASSAEIADVAEQVQERSKSPADPEIYLDGLDTLKFDVNSIGRELKTLDAERTSLAPWEVEALDRATSLMQDIATNTEKAIETYNSDRNHLWATSYPALTGKASEDADQVKTLLAGYLKLAKAHQQMDRLEHDLSASPQF